MEESSVVKDGFKCCRMCMRHCFETHGKFGRSEAEELFSAPSFFGLIKTSHITGSKFLRIPVLFMEKQNYNIGDKLSLKGPCGFECEVTVQHHNTGHVLHTGFNSFVEHHKIEAGDSLVFSLIAKSSFLVKVYDKCGSEKVFPTKENSTDADPVLVFKTPHKHRSRSKESRHEDTQGSDGEGVDEGSDEEAVDRMLNLRRKKLEKKRKVEASSSERMKGRLCSNQQESSFDQPAANVEENRLNVSPVRKVLDGGDGGDMKQFWSTRKQRSGQKSKLPAVPNAYQREEDKNEPHEFSEFERSEAAKRQVNAANALIQKLNNPSQLVVMSASHVQHAHGQHRVFLTKLPLPKVSTTLTLVTSTAEHYTVKWCVPSQGSRSRLTSGWGQLVVDHKLQIDDICVFEASDSHLITLHTFRLVDYYNPTTENQQQEQDDRDDLQPSALEQSMSEELDRLGVQEEDTASAGLCQTAKWSDERPGLDKVALADSCTRL